MTSLDLRGRDLVIIPPGELLHLPTPELLKTLFGTSLPAPTLATMRRDKRSHLLRTQPIHFAGIKSALRKQPTPFTVAFEGGWEARRGRQGTSSVISSAKLDKNALAGPGSL
jgi:hypothetical protein